MKQAWWGRTAAVAVLGAAVALAGCDQGATGPQGPAQASLSFTTGTGGVAATSGMATAADSVTVGDHTLVIDSVQVVLAKIELGRVEGSAACDTLESEDACEEFRAGPVLVNLPLDSGVITPFETVIPAGTYDRVNMKIHRPEGDSASSQFSSLNPDWPLDKSVHIMGEWDGQPFDLYLAMEANTQERLSPPLEVSDTTSSVNITVSVDVHSWFIARDGSLIDPTMLTHEGSLMEQVEHSIRSSFRGFEDHDRNGKDDHDEGHAPD